MFFGDDSPQMILFLFIWRALKKYMHCCTYSMVNVWGAMGFYLLIFSHFISVFMVRMLFRIGSPFLLVCRNTCGDFKSLILILLSRFIVITAQKRSFYCNIFAKNVVRCSHSFIRKELCCCQGYSYQRPLQG